MILGFCGLTSTVIWIYLLFFRGMFWKCSEKEQFNKNRTQLNEWPPVVIIIPCRNEEQTLPITLPSVIDQEYPGLLSIIVVDDQSEDQTSFIAETLSKTSQWPVSVVLGQSPPFEGWTGKLWALHRGVQVSSELNLPCKYYLFTDADILYAPKSLKSLVLQAEQHKFLLTSYMVKLNCESAAEKFLIPAFIFFFQMIFPFAWVNQRMHRTAAAAGGCVFIEKTSLERGGGLSTIKSELIDDCAIAKKIKKIGPIWLGLSESIRSIRKYPTLRDIRMMVARTAYAQLNYSILPLLGTSLGMGITFFSPLLLTFLAPFPVNIVGVITWSLMTVSFIPTLLYYRLSPIYAAFLPFIAMAYLIFTLESAYLYYCGKGGFWKGRVQAKQ